jgi:hypothetical protein
MGGRATERFVSTKDGHAKLRKARAPQIPQSGVRSPRPVVLCGAEMFTQSIAKNACLYIVMSQIQRLSLLYFNLYDGAEQHI